jgi:tetratricopeptide (TPR) repeat protein
VCGVTPESLLEAGTRALAENGDLRTSREWFARAYEAAQNAGDVHTLVAAALGAGGVWVHEHRTAAEAELVRSRIKHALTLVEPESGIALRLRLRLTAEGDYQANTNANVLALLEEARQVADPVVRVEALSLAHHCVLGPDHVDLRKELAAEMIGESLRSGRQGDLMMALLWQVVDHFLAADAHALRHLTDLRERLKHEDHLAVRFVVSAVEVMLAIRDGRFAEAEQLAGASAQLGAEVGDVDATAWYGAQLCAIRWYQGRTAELFPLLDHLVHSPTLSTVDNSFFAALAVAAALSGDRRKAQGALAMLCQRGLDALPRSSTWLVTMSGVADAAHLLDDIDVAREVYAILLPFAHLPLMASLAVTCFGSAHHPLGLSALTFGDVDLALTHLRHAVRDNLALGHWPAVLSSRRKYAEALERAGDFEEARRQLAACAEEAEKLGVRAPEPKLSITREGRQWLVRLGGRSALVDGGIGMAHLAVLAANPGREIDAAELVAGTNALSEFDEVVTVQEQLDPEALRQYRNRLSQLRGRDLSDAERAEHDWLAGEIAAATGLRGRSRAFTDSGERARIAVGKAIRRAVNTLSSVDQVIGDHVRHHVRTGRRCSYIAR